MIRPAKFIDIPRIVELMKEMCAYSKYRDLDKVDERAAHRLTSQCVQRHGHNHDGGALVMVSVNGETVEGFFIGMLDRTYHIGEKLAANDLFFYMSERAQRADALKLFEAYISWATSNPKVATIKASWTDAVDGAQRMAGLYERKGFTLVGEIYERFLWNERQMEAIKLEAVR